MGDIQAAKLLNVLEAGINANPDFSLDHIIPLLQEQGSIGDNLANKLGPFIKSQPFSNEKHTTWDSMLHTPDTWVNIIQLKGYSNDIYRLITEFVLWDLYDYACSSGSKNRPIPLVLDEIQNLNHRKDSPIDKMQREGRKFGLSLMLATQTVSNFEKSVKDLLFQAAHKLIFKPSDTEIKSYAEILNTIAPTNIKNEWSEKLSKLEKGQCYSVGQVLTSTGKLQSKAVLVNITSLEARNLSD
jgi:DNA phosphorothioation-dependent restriction protein DptH